MKILNEAKNRLRSVEEGLSALQSKYDECVTKKEELKEKCELCEARLGRAEKVSTNIIYGQVQLRKRASSLLLLIWEWFKVQVCRCVFFSYCPYTVAGI